jgi:glycosyltransferase involved in cell wall biosynthesis
MSRAGATGASSPGLSVIITTLNEAHNIAACIASVHELATEIVVIDSGSADGTAQAAAALGARVHVTADWPGFGAQKNRALARAACAWVLSIDADERVTPALAQQIREALATDQGPAGYEIARLSQFCGAWVRHSGWYPDYVLRLFRRAHARFSDDLVHERVLIDGPVARLEGHFLHYSYVDRAQVREKTERYARAGAEQLHRHGKRCSALSPAAHGAWAWIRTFVLRQGWRDGRTGLAVAAMNARASYGKYARLRQLNGAGVAAPR